MIGIPSSRSRGNTMEYVQPRRRSWIVRSRRAIGASLLLVAAGALAGGASLRTPADRLADGGDGRDWAAYGATYGEQHFSSLADINDGNVARLGLAWSLDLGPGNTATQALAVDGVLYFAQGYSVVHAVDAKTGKLLWTYDPEVAKHTDGDFPNGWGSRGIAWWDGKIFTATLDGRLISIDAKSGKPLWSMQTMDPKAGYYITGAPRAFDGKIIVGNSGSDFAGGCTPPNCPVVRGYVTAYDAKTGKQAWRFYVVPGEPAKGFEDDTMEWAAKTWSGKWWERGGGGTVWNAMTYDAEFDTVLIGTGNGAPHSHKARSEGKGDNLFLASIVALDAKTGKYKWHYQANPGENWDFNNAPDIQLAELKIDGRMRKVLVHAPKNGFVYVIDRTNGKLISAKPFVPVTWASHIDLKTGRPVENPAARDPDDPKFKLLPNSWGAHIWIPSAFSAQSNLLYIPALYNDPTVYAKSGPKTKPQKFAPGDLAATLPSYQQESALLAWDPVAQKQVWRVDTAGPANGGVMATAGNLVFQGEVNGRFSAFNARTGKRLWAFDAHAPVIAPPVTYRAGGKQYLSVLTGIGTASAVLGPQMSRFNVRYDQPRRLLTFELNGKGALPDERPTPLSFPDDEEFQPDATAAMRGKQVYIRRCLACHGVDGVAAGQAPDLRASAVPQSWDTFKSVVHEGALTMNGMPKFDYLSESELQLVRQYIRTKASEARALAK